MAASRSVARIALQSARPRVAAVQQRVVAASTVRSLATSLRTQQAAAQTTTTTTTSTAPTGKESPFIEPVGVNPVEQFKPFSAALQEYGAWIMASLPKFVQQTSVYKDELTIYVAPSAIEPVMLFLRDHANTQYKQVMDICGADYPARSNRFEVVYHLLSVRHNSRLRVKTYADETSPVPSIAHIYRGADWYEREAWDMYGILFSNHPDLRRILTDYGFEGHPLRKDFPLTGYTEVRYDEEKKRVVSEPLQLSQAFRNFEGAQSPWEGTGAGIDARAPQFVLQPPKEEGKQEEAKKDAATKK